MARQKIIRNGIIILILAAIAYTIAGKFLPPGGGGGGWGPSGPAPVSVAEVVVKSARQWHEFSGRLVAIDQAEIRPRVSGTIEKILFEDGALVRKGDPLFIIDPRPYQANYQ